MRAFGPQVVDAVAAVVKLVHVLELVAVAADGAALLLRKPAAALQYRGVVPSRAGRYTRAGSKWGCTAMCIAFHMCRQYIYVGQYILTCSTHMLREPKTALQSTGFAIHVRSGTRVQAVLTIIQYTDKGSTQLHTSWK